MSGKIRPFSKAPYSAGRSSQDQQWMDWATSEINQLRGQANIQPGAGFPALVVPEVQPGTSQINSRGIRTGSIATSLAYTATTTTITFWWDGSNGSQAFQIYRDDGSITPPRVVGSGFKVTGLTANTKYYFYWYWDEGLELVKPAFVEGAGVGVPPAAFTAPNLLAGQQQILRNRIPLAPVFSSQGITTPASGTGGGGGGTGGGSGGGRFQLP